MEKIQSILQNQILKAAEEQLDAEIEKLDKLTENDLEDIRRKRIQEMKQRQQQSLTWKANVSALIITLSDFKAFNFRFYFHSGPWRIHWNSWRKRLFWSGKEVS